MVWPLARRDALDFVRGKDEVLVVEEKRGIIESQFKEYFYDWPGHKPRVMVGKRDERGERLVPWTGELSPRALVPIVAGRLEGLFPGRGFAERAAEIHPRGTDRDCRRGSRAHALFLLGLSAQHLHQGAGGLQGTGRHRLPFHGKLDGPRDQLADSDGR